MDIKPIEIGALYGFGLDEKKTWLVNVSGLSQPDHNHRWTVGDRARFLFKLPDDTSTLLELQIEVRSIGDGKVKSPSADVTINGHLCERWDETLVSRQKVQWLRIAIPRDIKSGMVAIEIQVSGALSPAGLGINTDKRLLGFRLSRLKVVSVEPSRFSISRKVKPKLYIHGNCQSTALCKTLAENENFSSATSREVHLIDLEKDIKSYEFDIKSSDIIISQPISRGYRDEFRLSTDWIRQNCRKSAQVITILPLYFTGYSPSQGYIKGATSYRMPYHDYNLLKCFSNKMSAKEGIRLMRQEDFYSPEFLAAEVSQTLAESIRRESIFLPEIKLTDWIEEHYKENQLFFTFNHPSRIVFVEIATRIATMLGLPSIFSKSGPEYLDQIFLPPYWSTIRHLALREDGMVRGVRGHAVDFSLETYVSRLFAYYEASIGVERALDYLKAEPGAISYFKRYSANGR